MNIIIKEESLYRGRDGGLRRIETARDLASINEAVKEGYYPLIRRVEPSPEIHDQYRLMRDPLTGEIIYQNDLREEYRETRYLEVVLDWTSYYPYHFKSPYAAYLIPMDIKKGEEVFLVDLIEDYIGTRFNQGNNYRLQSCRAIWNGEDLEVLYDPSVDREEIIG